METVTLEVGAEPRVRMRLGGDLRLTGREGTTLEAQASARGGLTVAPQADGVEVSCQTACMVFLPERAQVEIEVVGGDGRLTGVTGDLRVALVGGDLCLRRVGQVHIDRVGGDLLVHRATGRLEVGWVGGDADLEHIEGDIQVQSIGGDLRTRRVSGSVCATVGGDAALQLEPGSGSSGSVQTGGDCSCRVSPEASLLATLKAGGDLRVTTPGTRETTPEGVVVRMGDAEAELSLSAGGDLNLRSEGVGPEGAFVDPLGTDFGEKIQSQVEAALAEAEASLGGISGEAFGIDADRIRYRMRRGLEHARRRVERAREREARAAGEGATGRRRVVLDLGIGNTPRTGASAEERLSVLQMLEQGTLTVEEAQMLLRSLEGEA